jgi:hypothetical protein
MISAARPVYLLCARRARAVACVAAGFGLAVALHPAPVVAAAPPADPPAAAGPQTPNNTEPAAPPAEASPTAKPGAPSPLSPEKKKAAAAAFNRGEDAYASGNFNAAGAAFEEAFSHVPHPSALWNAARAWNRAGDLARAANLFTKYLREAPPDAPDRKSAVASLEQLTGKLGKLNIYAPDFPVIEIDGQVIEGSSVFVTPGTHIVRGRSNDKSIERVQGIEAGGIASVALVQESAPPPKKNPDARGGSGEPGAPDQQKPVNLRVLPRIAVGVGGAATALTLGFTIWSGLDTLSARAEFDLLPTQSNLDAGRGKQTRTNVLLGVTLGLAALTGTAAVFFVDWSKGSGAPPVEGETKVGLGLGSVHVTGSF